METDDRITVGRVLRPWGIKGEVKVEILSDYPERFLERVGFFVSGEYMCVEEVRFHQGAVLLKFERIESLEQAESLRDAYLEVETRDIPPLGRDEYYWFEIMGLRVYTVQGRYLGTLVEILPNAGVDVYRVEEPDSGETDYLIPAAREIVVEVDLERERMTVDPPKGLLDL